MSSEGERLSKIETQLMMMAGSLGRIEGFIDRADTDREILFKKVNEIQQNGCSNSPNHALLRKDVETLVETVKTHDATLNKIAGAWVATGTISAILGTVGGWVLSLLPKGP